jgi:endonuclease/exonuclease/phosphatase family metal-dependent hydrolase
LIDKWLASYNIPHGLCWLVHVKVFNYVGWLGPTHFLNVYLKSGGNHRRTWREQLTAVKDIVKTALVKDSRACFIILGDFNEDPGKVLKHLKNVIDPNVLVSTASVGSNVSHFSARGMLRALDSFFVTKEVHDLVRPSQVL